MKYKVGMYGGSFDPLHIGHIHDIIRAAGVCDELYVMISYCEGRESVPKEIRYRWILNLTRHLSNVKIIMIEDEAVSKDVYNTDFYWEKGAQDIKDTIGKPIDAVFCGTDYLGTNRFESLYCPESEVVYFDRTEVPISSTDIRTWATDNWDYIPSICRAWYTRKVLIIGGESSGKSTLVTNLALAYNTNYVSEVGRDTCEYAGGEELMVGADLIENILKQRVNVDEAIKHSNRICFVDTDAITTKFYIDLLLGESDNISVLANAVADINEWDLVLFLEPDVEFVQDGTRNEEIAANRKMFSEQLKSLYSKKGVPFEVISAEGVIEKENSYESRYNFRFDEAKRLIWERLHIATDWYTTNTQYRSKGGKS